MTLRPIKAKHSSILRARRARLSNGRGHWGDFKPRFSLPRANGKFNPFFSTRKGKALVLILLSLTLLFTFDQVLKTPGQPSPVFHQDPLKPLWGETLSTNDMSSFRCSGGLFSSVPAFRNNAFGSNGFPGENLKGVILPTNNFGGVPIGSVCIDKTPMELSTAAAKVVDLWNNWGWNNSVSGVFPSQLSFFLTRNVTAPVQLSDYIPNADPNVALVVLISVNAGGVNTVQTIVYMQRDPTISIQGDDHGCTNTAGSVFFCGGIETITPQGWQLSTTASYGTFLQLNYTGSSATSSPSLLHYINYGPGANGGSGGCIPAGTCNIFSLPWFNLQSQKYYWGLAVRGASSACPCNNPVFGGSFDPQIIGNEAVPTNSGGMEVEQYTPPTISLSLDTGGFFGPVIKALVSLGVFMLNAALQFVAFIAPGLQTGFSFMVTFYRTLFDILGNLIWPNSNLGTAIFNELGNFVSWMVDSNNGLLAAFGNSTAIFGRFVDALKVTFPWLPTALAIALNLLTLAVNSVGEVITLVSLAMTLIVGGFAFYVLFFYFVYVGDDALGGVLGWMETMQWLIFNIGLAWTARISNYGIDIITAVIGIIPKPFVQMVAHQIPRIPIIETNARFVAPSFDFGEARAGNIFSFALWSIGLDFLAWYESRNPALPGSIGALIPNAVTPLLALNGMLPFLNLIVIISWGACIAWMGTRALALAGLDITSDMPLSVGPGRKISSGPKGFKISKHTKRFQGKLEKQGKHFQGRLARKVGERVNEAEKEKKITEAFREAARKNQEQVEVKKARQTGERIAKEELARRQKAEPGAK